MRAQVRFLEWLVERWNVQEQCFYIGEQKLEIEPADIVEFMEERNMNGVRLQLQLHKFIWEPTRRGV